jgi:uncharacterized phiE125 gp8 family phage protein
MPLNYHYELVTSGKLPVTPKDAKSYLKIDSDSDDDVLQKIIEAAVLWAERYTGRDFRAKTWKLTIDCFEDRILLRKSQVASVNQIQYTVSAALVTVASSVYYLKRTNAFSEVLLGFDQTWPTDGDQIEAGIEITFDTAIPKYIDEYCVGLLRHIAHLYQNRGDCSVGDAARLSGAVQFYKQGRIVRV